MKKLLLLLTLSFFSIQGLAGGCPDGSEPVKSISADGTYFVYNCGGSTTSSSVNINAGISQSGITDLRQLDNNQILKLISGNKLTGFISDGPFQGPITHTFYQNRKYETIFDNKIYSGIWKVENKKVCSKKNTASNFNCVYWYKGFEDGRQYHYIVAQGTIFQQFSKVISLAQLNQDKKKAQEKIKVEAKKKAEEKRIADIKAAENRIKEDLKILKNHYKKLQDLELDSL
jgi:hypothetical protein